jgi:hypothetical protein
VGVFIELFVATHLRHAAQLAPRNSTVKTESIRAIFQTSKGFVSGSFQNTKSRGNSPRDLLVNARAPYQVRE